MAKQVRTIIEYTDDLTGQLVPEGEVETMVYAFDGKSYEIDLSRQNADDLRLILSPVIAASRRLDTRGKNGPGKLSAARAAARGRQLALESGDMSRTAQEDQATAKRREIRTWARANGFPDQSMVGKIKAEVYDAWDKAHPDDIAERPE